METKRCWLCEAPLDTDEIQYCTCCELMMLQEIAGEAYQERDEEEMH